MRLVISKKTDIALRALRLLSDARGEVVSGAELSMRLDAGAAHLSQVMKPLVAAGWVLSRPGPDGGYALAARRLSVRDVLEAIEGPIVDGVCVLQGGECGGGHPCAMHATWASAREAFSTSLGRTSAI